MTATSNPAMAPRHVMLVLGTRPEAIKMMPVLLALRARPGLRATLCATGQHRALLDQVLAAFDAGCDIDLGLMAPAQTPADLTARILLALGPVLAAARPDLVLVHGDTTTALAAALAAFHAGIPVGHVEAGLRSQDLTQPFPEEFHRVAVDALARLRFAPTAAAAANLRAEYNRQAHILVTGNTGIDALLGMAARLSSDAAFRARETAALPPIPAGARLILVTTHRRENLGEGLVRIAAGLAALAARPDVALVVPLHPNPAVGPVLARLLDGHANIHLVPPLTYPQMVHLMGAATLLVTDSGGLQEEGPALGKPVLVLREVTERPEALATGLLRLVGTDPAALLAEASRLLDDPALYGRLARPAFPYGDGRAAERIVDAIEGWGAA